MPDWEARSQVVVVGTGVAGLTCAIDVAFRPAFPGILYAGLVVTDTAGGAPPQRAALSGRGIAPRISLGDETYNYGTVSAPTNATFTLSNAGSAPFGFSVAGF